MDVFVSLPMYGLLTEDVIARQREVMNLMGYSDCELIDNVTHAELPVTAPRVAHLGYSISLMAQADLVLFDSNWKKANGCLVERIICDLYRIPYEVLK